MTESNPQLESKSTQEVNPNQLIASYSNGRIDSLYIKGTTLPAMRFGAPGNVSERSPLLLRIEPCQKAAVQVLNAAIHGFKSFKIEYVNDKLKLQSTWTFHGAYVSAIDFGDEDPAEPKEVKCEISYEFLDINGVKL